MIAQQKRFCKVCKRQFACINRIIINFLFINSYKLHRLFVLFYYVEKATKGNEPPPQKKIINTTTIKCPVFHIVQEIQFLSPMIWYLTQVEMKNMKFCPTDFGNFLCLLAQLKMDSLHGNDLPNKSRQQYDSIVGSIENEVSEKNLRWKKARAVFSHENYFVH